MTEESPAERFERWIAENETPPPRRRTDPLGWGEIAMRAALVAGAAALYGGLAYGAARLVGWAP